MTLKQPVLAPPGVYASMIVPTGTAAPPRWKKLPPGVTAPTEVTIPADKDSVDVDLTAAADAAAVMIPDLQVTATTKFQGADVSAESPPLVAEIKK